MKKASITQAKNNLSALIDGLKAGSPILIVDRGRPVARLESVTADQQGDPDGRLSRLVRDGVVRPRRTPPSKALFTSPPPSARNGASVVGALVEERRDGR